MENNNQKNQSKQIILSVLAVAILIVAVIGASLAVFTYTGTGTEQNTVSTGSIIMNYTEDTNGISIVNAVPMSTTDGMNQQPGGSMAGENRTFDFTVSATMSAGQSVGYDIVAVKDGASTLSDNQVYLYLESESGGAYSGIMSPARFTGSLSESTYGAPSGTMTLYTGQFNQSSSAKYRLKMWVAEDAASFGEYTDKTYTVKIDVYGKAL